MLIYDHLTTLSVSVYFLAADSGYQGKPWTSGLPGRRCFGDSSIHVRHMMQKISRQEQKGEKQRRRCGEISYSFREDNRRWQYCVSRRGLLWSRLNWQWLTNVRGLSKATTQRTCLETCYRGDMHEKLNNNGKLIDINIIQLFGLVWRQNKPTVAPLHEWICYRTVSHVWSWYSHRR